MSWMLENFVIYLCVYTYICSAGYVELTYCSVVCSSMFGVFTCYPKREENLEVYAE